MADSTLVFRLLGSDAGASRAIAGVGKTAEATSLANVSAAEKSSAAWAKATKALNVVGKASAVIAIGIGVEGVKAAAAFEQAMARINTQAGVSRQAVAKLGQGVLALSPQVGVGPTELAGALYHVESAFQSTGISGQKALSILKVAAEGAQVGGSNLVDTTNALDAAIVSGIPGVKNYQQAMGALNGIVGAGDMSMQDLADAFGTGAVAVVKNYGLSLTDVGAALATFGDNNIRGAEAGTALRQSVMALAEPVAGGKKAIEGIGLSMNTLKTDMQQHGLNGALQDLVTHMNDAGITGNKIGGFLTTAFGKKAGVGLSILTGQFDRFESKIGEVAKASSSFATDWSHQQDTYKQKVADLKASWDVFEVKVGDALIPTLKKITDELAKHPQILKDAAIAVGIFAAAWTVFKISEITTGLLTMSRAILGIGAASTAAAGETRAAGLGSAVTGAETAGAAGAAGGAAVGVEGAAAATGLARVLPAAEAGLSRVAVPIAVVLTLVNTAEAVPKLVAEVKAGHYGDAVASAMKTDLGKAFKVGDFPATAANYTVKGATALLHDLFGGGKSSSDAAKAAVTQAKQIKSGFDIAKDSADSFWSSITEKGPVNTFDASLKNSGFLLDSASDSLVGNTASVISNRKGLKTLALQAVAGAKSYSQWTGVTTDNTAALAVGVTQILNAASATGINRTAAANYLNTIIKIPGYKITTLGLVGTAVAQQQVNAFLASLALIPPSIQVPIETYIKNPTTTILAGAAMGYSGPSAAGTYSVPAGMRLVGERGPELVKLPAGTQVVNHSRSQAMMGGGANITINVTAIDAASFRNQLRNGGLGKVIASELNRQGINGQTYN